MTSSIIDIPLLSKNNILKEVNLSNISPEPDILVKDYYTLKKVIMIL